MEFGHCSFDEASSELFESMFHPNSNLRSFGLICGSVSFAKPMSAILGTILHKDSPLELLYIWGTGNREAGSIVSTIMMALEVNTTLRKLWLDGIGGDVREAVENGLPKLRGLKKLSCSNFHLDDAQRPAVMEAFKRNHSIIETTGVERAFPDEDDKKKLRFYAARNQNIPMMLENPARLPISAWPKVIEISQHCESGANTVFRALLELEERNA